MSLLSDATDVLYGTKRASSTFEMLNPDEPVLLSAACKARLSKQSTEMRSWAFARRSTLLVTEKRIVCGDWELLLEQVERASYKLFGGILSNGLVLIVHGRDNEKYEFGLSKPEEWLKPFPLELHQEESYQLNRVVVWVARIGFAGSLLAHLL